MWLALIFAVVVALVGGLIKLFWKRIRARWVTQEEWSGKFTEEGKAYSENLTIFHRGSRLWGESRLVVKEGDREREIRYRIRGVLREGLVSALYEDVAGHERGAFLLVHSNAARGSRSYRGKYLICANNSVEAIDYSWAPRQ